MRDSIQKKNLFLLKLRILNFDGAVEEVSEYG